MACDFFTRKCETVTTKLLNDCLGHLLCPCFVHTIISRPRLCASGPEVFGVLASLFLTLLFSPRALAQQSLSGYPHYLSNRRSCPRQLYHVLRVRAPVENAHSCTALPVALCMRKMHSAWVESTLALLSLLVLTSLLPN